jgi:hypothetical protein
MTALDISTDPPTRHSAKMLEMEAGDLDYPCACAESVGVTLADG